MEEIICVAVCAPDESTTMHRCSNEEEGMQHANALDCCRKLFTGTKRAKLPYRVYRFTCPESCAAQCQCVVIDHAGKPWCAAIGYLVRERPQAGS